MTTTKDYELRALRIAAELRLTVKIDPGPLTKCPPWAEDRGPGKRANGCGLCGAVHGRHYFVTITRATEFRPATCRACGYSWRAPVQRRAETPNISGEATLFCPGCGGRGVDAGPIETEPQRGRREPSLGFDYWGSWADAHPEPTKSWHWNNRDAIPPKHPTVYDVLACVGSDASMPTDPDDVVADLGDMKPSQANAIAQWAARLRRFFSAADLAKLAEVDQ